MTLINTVAAWFLKKRIHQIELFMKYPHDVQNEWFMQLIRQGADTEWGRKYAYDSIGSYREFNERVPLNTYDDLKPYIDRVRLGQEDVLWPGKVKWFAKSSGTTRDKSKFIPVTEESMDDCHYRAGKDMLAFYYNDHPDSEALNGKAIGVAGSSRPDDLGKGEAFVGDLSAILMNNLPFWASISKTPNLSVALLENWEQKVNLMAQHTLIEDVRIIAGVPSWMLVILHKALELSGKRKIRELWPDFELVIHGGVSFLPYRRQFEELMDERVRYLEVYNASEGFFGVQDQSQRDDMLLMLDYGIFYEFIPMTDYDSENPEVLPLSEVQCGVNYAMVISTNAGLWRYLIGDTVVFTSNNPYRFRISGRVRSYINIAGEELMVENADKAIRVVCDHTGAVIKEYSAAPLLEEGQKRHQWLFEFEKDPEDPDYFAHVFDNALKSFNSDYEAKRYRNMVLQKPRITRVQNGTFYSWLASKGKLGGQFKVPRLSNDRHIVEELLQIDKKLSTHA